MLGGMVILHVYIRVRPELLEAFQEATLQNARQSVQEPGCLRFDFAQQADEPTRYVLVEVYRHEAAVEAHRQTAHYAKWRKTAEPMMAEPRQRTILKPLFPTEEGAWS
jgi:autoinducer 2-degrading protein